MSSGTHRNGSAESWFGLVPTLAFFIAAGRALGFSVCTRFDLRDRLSLAPDIQDYCLGILDLSRI